MNSKIIRTVHGHHADPKSTRDLSQVTSEELDHIRMSCEAGRLEAETYLAMDNAELKATLERNIQIISEAGLGVPSAVPVVDKVVRQYLRTRYRAIGSLLCKIGKARDGSIKGITPLEYEHLVTSLQAGYREAEVCCAFSKERLFEAFGNVRQIRDRLGLGFENPYSEHFGDYFEFFQERAEVLWDLLWRVNLPQFRFWRLGGETHNKSPLSGLLKSCQFWNKIILHLKTGE